MFHSLKMHVKPIRTVALFLIDEPSEMHIYFITKDLLQVKYMNLVNLANIDIELHVNNRCISQEFSLQRYI